MLIKQLKSLQEIQDEKDYLQMLESQRQYRVQQNKDIHIDEEILRLQLYQIDTEEEKLKDDVDWLLIAMFMLGCCQRRPRQL